MSFNKSEHIGRPAQSVSSGPEFELVSGTAVFSNFGSTLVRPISGLGGNTPNGTSGLLDLRTLQDGAKILLKQYRLKIGGSTTQELDPAVGRTDNSKFPGTQYWIAEFEDEVPGAEFPGVGNIKTQIILNINEVFEWQSDKSKFTAVIMGNYDGVTGSGLVVRHELDYVYEKRIV